MHLIWNLKEISLMVISSIYLNVQETEQDIPRLKLKGQPYPSPLW